MLTTSSGLTQIQSENEMLIYDQVKQQFGPLLFLLYINNLLSNVNLFTRDAPDSE